ncbi:hypothetical protein [Cupriavidus oxalaticus]|uniref:Uncharacterized protein n=1 Tax=Cupriavidus oxalaticus TaxID=96344 RepID=A0A375G1M2_9BURK|nr:hypothetical protein [Cupriavidus oxalaticus]QEZ48489.1 hypothetical protein D2917_21345 [Cupriavidus oxalaticus]QRQ88920.1 hypothetical protein JTE91_20545 [Cupriavidus oxalaticus]QRQ92754.1 hypothetical protein JTE92_21715 [Cupriavidus oxalaticus]WQD81359.1 hypothetical protein U0036_09445 [Cupriavidus oxalaticus]SPC12657.1 conserved hypothetical protein [Cupriavidus oxalaticus]
MTPELPYASETTPEGLARLIEHIRHAAGQGDLDPVFVRKLAKRIGKEFQEMKAARPGDAGLAGLESGIEALLLAADSGHGARLTKSLQRLRENEGASGGASPASH